MFKARKNVDTKGKKRDIIKEYSNFGSVVYAPITRDGLPLDKKASKYEVQPDALLTYNGVTELSNTMPARLFKTVPNKFKFSTKLTRKQVHHKAELIKAQALINVKGESMVEEGEVGEEDKKQDDIYSLKNMAIRPQTPECGDLYTRKDADKLKVEIEQEKAVILLQRLLRG